MPANEIAFDMQFDHESIDNRRLEQSLVGHYNSAVELIADALTIDLQQGYRTWPILTGFSKANFFYRYFNDEIEIWNNAYYAKYVEARGSYVEELWNRREHHYYQLAEERFADG